ncbi:arginine deiminase [Jonquetella anthropi DSM 22815]|uniref:Arginine deiminase n=1 Tax=Jonquetella anthropi DSM 22815 TaxID=885272 RepID=H0UJK1_9BACT|nr:arginine deiminase family protein [Jonquetella anthropi]EHM12869.1 arginine deiminase [Jonquetella anthropi DSM 22815]
MAFHVSSEIGRLREVIMQPPGCGIERCTPTNVSSLAWDAVPSPKKALEEHKEFVRAVESFGTKVFLFEDLLRETLENPIARAQVVCGVIDIERPFLDEQTCETVADFLSSLSPQQLVDRLFYGMTKLELSEATDGVSLRTLADSTTHWCLYPMTNVLYSRDPAIIMGDLPIFGVMNNPDRHKEPLCYKAIFTYHPHFADWNKQAWYGKAPGDTAPIEGGNVHCYSSQLFVVGVNDRTRPQAIEQLARRTMDNGPITDVLALMFDNPRMNAADPMGMYLHVDMFLNMIDHDAFLFYPYVEEKITALHITRGAKNTLKVHREDSLFGAIKRLLGLSAVRIIKVGGEEAHDVAFAEQRAGSGGNTVNLEPGRVCIWDRNEVTIEALQKGGINVVAVKADELVKGGGGPRCSTMPLIRDDL